MFALYRLLGYQYSPRLADAGAATLWRINATDYGPLNPLARHQINTRLIREHYDDVLRIAGSLLQRHTTASQLVRALRSHTRHLATRLPALFVPLFPTGRRRRARRAAASTEQHGRDAK